MIARARANAGALWLLTATMVANVLGFGYQLVMARLLTAEQYAILIALFGVLILESISSQVIQSATALCSTLFQSRLMPWFSIMMSRPPVRSAAAFSSCSTAAGSATSATIANA